MRSRLLLVLCLVDLLFSVYGLLKLGMREGNPLFEALWNISPILFVVVKLLVTALAMRLFRYVWDRDRALAEFGMSVAIGGYILAAIMAVLINSGLI